ncbi:MAG: hypothetical protein HYX67_14000 [Candidatus Melainabacteria bacterium]|nr:hypothetical protein [Candidatus Melainabacteria bacterium]
MAANYLKTVLILSLFILAGCFARTSMMTFNEYDNVKIGDEIVNVQSEVGKPYAIHNKAEGTQEYEYVERINNGNNLVAENHYFLIVEKGKVIGKYVNREGLPAYDLIYQPEPNYSYPNTP